MAIKRVNELRKMIIVVLLQHNMTLDEISKVLNISRRQAYNIRKGE
jgi:DNA-directed RNA polymerase specialized sigma subunit